MLIEILGNLRVGVDVVGILYSIQCSVMGKGEGGHWVVYYTITTNYSTTLGTFLNFAWLVHYVECPNVITNNCNLQKV